MKSTVLCYNLKGTKKGKQIAMIFGFLGYKIRHVEKEEYEVPIGVLAGASSRIRRLRSMKEKVFRKRCWLCMPRQRTC